MKVLVCGGRDFYDFQLLVRILDELHKEFTFTRLLHGNARGADQLAARWSRSATPVCSSTAFPADWGTYGSGAGNIRNQQMLDEGQPALVVAFPGGPGTAHMKRIARAAGVRVIEVSNNGTLTRK
jgi:hypothetical protein